jgi:hypothetical protein
LAERKAAFAFQFPAPYSLFPSFDSIAFGGNMESAGAVTGGARSNEDIALDLLKFVAGSTGFGRAAVPSAGFSGTSAPKPEEQVNQLLDLYGRCLNVVSGKGGKA